MKVRTIYVAKLHYDNLASQISDPGDVKVLYIDLCKRAVFSF